MRKRNATRRGAAYTIDGKRTRVARVRIPRKAASDVRRVSVFLEIRPPDDAKSCEMTHEPSCVREKLPGDAYKSTYKL